MAWNWWDTAGGEPLYASRLNRGSSFTSTDTTDLKGVNTTGAPNTLKTTHLLYGQYALNTSSTATDMAEFRIEPTTGPGAWELIFPHGDAITEWLSESFGSLRLEIDRAKSRISDLESINASGRAVHLFQQSIITPGGGSVAANTEVESAISFPGILPTDFPIYNAPQDLEDQLVVAHVSIPVKDTFVVHIRNTKTGSVTTIPRPWYIGIIRNVM